MHQAERDRIYSHLMNFERRLQAIESAQQTRTQEPQPDSDGWIPWHGGPCPVNGETKVDVRLHCGAELPAYRAKDLTWWHYKNRPASRIIAYRPAKQEAEWPLEEPTACDSDGWIPWHGGECPVSKGTLVDVIDKSGDVYHGKSALEESAVSRSFWEWNCSVRDRIISYRLAKQEAEWPQVGGCYWRVDARGNVHCSDWHGGPFDKGFQNFLGIYPTREAAEDAAPKIKRVMEHLRSGRSIHLWDTDNMAGREVIKL